MTQQQEAPCRAKTYLPAISLWILSTIVFGTVQAPAAELPPLEGRTNLASGREVVFSPTPNYTLTKKGDTDHTDLTDGKLTSREDRRLWFDSAGVGWSYGGRVNLALDLGKSCAIDEIAIRLLGGSPQAGISIPGWIEAFVSDDGENFAKVAEFSRWQEGDFARHEVPDEEGKSWVHCLRLADLKTQGRWIGLRMYTAGLSATDELYVFGSPTVGQSGRFVGKPSTFTVTHPQPHFHKPHLVVATNATAPVSIGIVVPESFDEKSGLKMKLDLPPGLELAGGGVGPSDGKAVEVEATADGGRSYRFSVSAPKSSKTFGRLYLRASGFRDGQTGQLRYSFSHSGWQSPVCTLPVRAVEIPPAPRLKRIMTGLGWWSAPATEKWPDALDAWDVIGLNSFSLSGHWMKEDDPTWGLTDEARSRGFFIVNIDSTLHRMVERRKNEPEIRDQLEDGSVGEKLCVSYRGQYYREEIERFAKVMGRTRPHFTSQDIELWGWQGPTDCQKCTRCQADFIASGLESWDEWKLAKGEEIWREMIVAARAELKKSGGPRFEAGGYDFRPGHAYQSVWSVDRMYPEFMQDSQVSTYSCLYPYHLGMIGDRVRSDREKLGRSDVMPWLTPGDAGTFSGQDFAWALLECHANGARGIYFWSGRVWDAQSLIAYNGVVRAIAPVEDLIVDGDLIGDAASVVGSGRISGMRKGNQIMLLAADYFRHTGGSVKLQLAVSAKSEIVDLISGQVVKSNVAVGRPTIEIPLEGARARLLHVRPLK
jgi:hypothetical protein